MRPRLRILFVLALACHWRGAAAQTLDVPEWTPQGKPIVAKVADLPEGSRVAWIAGAGGSVAKVNASTAHLWGSVGVQTPLTAVVIPPGEADPVLLNDTYGVEGAAPPTPPVVVKTLAELAGKDAPALSAIYAKLLADVKAGSYETVEQFTVVHNILLTDLGLATNGAGGEILKRIDVDTLDKLKAALEGIVKELGAGPGPVVPPPPGSKRLVVIVRESEDDTPDMAFLFNALRTGPEAKWLKDNGYPTPRIHDDDDVDQNGNSIPLVEQLEKLGPEPGLFLLEPSTLAVVHNQALPKTAAEVLDVVKAH